MADVTRHIQRKLVAVTCDESAVRHAEWLLGKLEGMVQSGLRLQGGATISFGWVPLTLQQLHEDEFAVCAPDFRNLPNVTRDLTTSLLVNAEQLSLTRTARVQPTFSTYDQVLFVACEAWSASKVTLSRFRDRSALDSGWTALPTMGEGTSFDRVRVYEILDRKRGWMQALALPAGYVVDFDGDELAAIGGPGTDMH